MPVISQPEQRVRVEDLPRLHLPLARALGEAGVGGARIHELFAGPVRVECLGCGVAVTAEELGRIGPAPGEASAEDPKLGRLRLGYCARNGCNSKFYLLRTDPAPGVEWPAVIARTEQLLDAPEETAPTDDGAPATKPTLRGRWEKLTPWRRMQLLVLAGVLLLFGLFQWYQHGFRVVGISPKPRTFIVEPGAEDAARSAAGEPANPSKTNAPRTFIVR